MLEAEICPKHLVGDQQSEKREHLGGKEIWKSNASRSPDQTFMLRLVELGGSETTCSWTNFLYLKIKTDA